MKKHLLVIIVFICLGGCNSPKNALKEIIPEQPKGKIDHTFIMQNDLQCSLDGELIEIDCLEKQLLELKFNEPDMIFLLQFGESITVGKAIEITDTFSENEISFKLKVE